MSDKKENSDLEQKSREIANQVMNIPEPTWARAALGAFIIWLCWMTVKAHGWGGLLTLFWWLMGVGAAAGLIEGIFGKSNQGKDQSKPRNRKLIVFYCLMLSLIFWIWFTGSFRSLSSALWDIGAICAGSFVGSVVAAAIVARVRGEKVDLNAADPQTGYIPAAMLLAGWLAITPFTLLREHPLPRDPQRFAAIGPANSIVAPEAARWQQVRVGLALSGGGYRAAVYHAGALHALEKLGLKPAVLSTVSGGSIIGAYYALGGDPAAFKDAVADGRFNLKRELLMAHNAVRLPFPLTVPFIDVPLFPWFDYSRRDVQANLLERSLFGDDESWRKPGPGQPVLVIATTDLTFGQQLGLLPDGVVSVWTDRVAEAYAADAWLPAHDFSLADRVAMSGGFPGAFPAASSRVSVKSPEANGSGERPLLIADGGIFDNSGFLLLQAADKLVNPRLASDVFLVSDAGAIFGVEQELNGLGQVMRAADVGSAMARIRVPGSDTRPRVDFSAQDHFLPPAAQFRQYTGEEGQFAGDAGIQLDFDPGEAYPPAVLEEIVRLLPVDSREAAQAALLQFKATNQEEHAATLRKLVRAAVAAQLTDFRAASTLDDLPSPERVELLYSLGQMLVYLQWPELARAMDSAIKNAE